MTQHLGIEYLLDLHGQSVHREDGYWWKIEAWPVKISSFIPHGIRYNLTLHNRFNQRIFGIDNAHAIKPPKKGRFSGRVVYDHMHRSPIDKGVPYEFVSPEQLLSDFFLKVDDIIAERENRG